MPAAASSLIVRVGADISSLTSGLRTATNRVNQFAQRNQEALQAVGAVGAALTGIGVAAGAGIGYAVKVSADFESAFAGVKKTVDATDKEIEGFRKGILKMAQEIPASAEEIAGVAEAAGQLGIKNEAIMGFTETMVNMGVATNMASEDAATALARLANITQMPQENFDRLGATIVDLGNNLATTESEIVEMGLRIAGAGSQVGLTEAQILSFAGALSSVGIEAEAGGTAFSRVMIEMSSAAQLGGDNLDNFAKVAGMSSADFKKAFEEDASGAIITFIEGLGKMSKEGQNVFGVLEDLGLSEIRVRDALLRASGAGDLFRKSLETGTKAWEENIALTKEASERYKTFDSQIKILQNKLKHIVRIIGDEFKAVLVVLMKALDPVIDGVIKMAEKFSKLHPAIKMTAALIAMAATAFALLAGPLLILVGFLPMIVIGFNAIVAALPAVLGAISAVAAPIAIAVAAIVGLVAAFNWLYKNVEWFATSVDFVLRKTKESFLSFVEVAKVGLEGIKRFFKDVGNFMRAFLNGDWTQAKELFVKIFTNAWDSLKKLGGKYISEIKKLWGDEFNKLVEIIGEFKTKAIDKLDEWRKSFAEWSAGLWNATVDGFNSWWTSVANWFTQKSTDMRALLDEWGETIVGWFKSLPSKVGGKLNAWWTSISGWFTKKSTDMRSLLDGWGEAAIAWIKELPSKAMEGLGKFAEALKQWTMSQHQENVRQFTEWGNAIIEWFTTMPERMSEKLSAWGEAIMNWFNEVPAQTIESMMAWRESVLGWFEEVRVGMLEKLTGWGESIMTWFSEIPGRISEAFTAWWATITGWFDTTKESITTKLGEWWTAISNWFSTRPAEIYAQLGVWWEKISQWFSEVPGKITAKLGEWWTAIKTWFSSIPNKPEIKDSGKKMVDKLAEGNNEKKPEFMDKLGKIIVDVAIGAIAFAGVALIAAGREIVKRFIEGIKQIDLKQTGRDMVRGLIGGIGEMVGAVANKAKELAIAAKSSVERWLDINSPSRVFKKLGVHTGEGFVLGMDSMINDVANASGRLADAAIVDAPDLSTSFNTPNAAGAGVMAGLSVDHTNSSSDNAVSIMQQALQMMSGMQVVMDGERVGTLIAPTVNREIARDNASTTRRKGQRR